MGAVNLNGSVKGTGTGPALIVGKFELDGTNAPINLSPALESVTRITADTTSLALYRVRFRRNDAPGRDRLAQRASIVQDGSARRNVEVVSGALVATVAADQDLEIDVGVVSGGALTNSLDGPVVSVEIYAEQYR